MATYSEAEFKAGIPVYRGDAPSGGERVFNQKDLDRVLRQGYSLNPVTLFEGNTGIGGGSVYDTSGSESPSSATDISDARYDVGIETAKALFSWFPEPVMKAYARAWVKFGKQDLALAETRNSSEWEAEFGFLKREDGTLIKSEVEAMAAIASYKETLREIGITNTEDFKKQFQQLVAGETSPDEFQQRIDIVYEGVIDNIPQVENLFRTQYGIDTDAPTIFAALINPEINDKLLKGNIKSVQIQAEGMAAGFSVNFERAKALEQAGLTQEKARQLYQVAGRLGGMAAQTGREFGVGTLESATIGDAEAQEEIDLLQGEAKTMSSARVGAKKKDGKVTGLLEG